MSAEPLISIIIPTWNNLEFLKLSVGSIVRHTKLPFELVIHVNDGGDGTLQWVKEQALDHTHTETNVGICHALNLAVQKCHTNYIAYLNDDMYALPDWDVPLYEFLCLSGELEPSYVSGTMIQASPINPASLSFDYGSEPHSFQEQQLLDDFHAGQFAFKDWSGATWPPCMIHRKWWDRVDGYSVEFSPGFYSDIDFSMKLWSIGCRNFCGVGSSLVYHFSERTTSLMRGRRNRNVKEARARFIEKWGFSPSAFIRYHLRAGRKYKTPLSGPKWSETKREQLRAGIRSLVRRVGPRKQF